ncbi:hypothetical protein, partial [Escherichia coli]|uniref:hypothetical protein n=1 Tax=Escherichia coli TaxID=562 RepID=UPI003D334CD3
MKRVEGENKKLVWVSGKTRGHKRGSFFPVVGPSREKGGKRKKKSVVGTQKKRKKGPAGPLFD